MADLTLEQLRGIAPHAPAEALAPLNAGMVEADVSTALRMAAFLAQMALESDQFRAVREVWTNSPAQQRYERPIINGAPAPLVKPGPGVHLPLWQRLGNLNRGDGFKYRGRGWVELTGRANYEAAGKALGLDLVNFPELAEVASNSARIAAWYWSTRDLNPLADEGNFTEITERINGGQNGAAQREAFYQRALQVLGAVAACG